MYTAKVIELVSQGEGYWSHAIVGVFDKDNNKVGEYKRNYGALYDTFFPFKQGDEWFALYSSDYTATRVMKLPECEDIAGEDADSFGFCPTKFYVPQADEGDKAHAETLEELCGTFGFVAGCIWGDDSSWKIQYLDLSRIKDGILTRDERFGYIEMPNNVKNLADCFNFRYFSVDDPEIQIYQSVPFYLTGKNAELQANLKQENSELFWNKKKAERDQLESITGFKVSGWTMIGAKPIIKKDDGIEYVVDWDGNVANAPMYQNRDEWIKQQSK